MDLHYKTICYKSLPIIFNGLRTTIKSFSDFDISPIGSVYICLRQDSRSLNFLRGNPLPFDQTVQQVTFNIGQTNYIFLGMAQPSLVGRTLTQNLKKRYPNIEV